jgi:hypothetical protein
MTATGKGAYKRKILLLVLKSAREGTDGIYRDKRSYTLRHTGFPFVP